MKTFQLMKQARLFQNILGIPRMIKKPGIFGKSRHFRKMPGFFFKRLKLDQLKKKPGIFLKCPAFSRKCPTFSTKTAYPEVYRGFATLHTSGKDKFVIKIEKCAIPGITRVFGPKIATNMDVGERFRPIQPFFQKPSLSKVLIRIIHQKVLR